jgi:hypothetical protein
LIGVDPREVSVESQESLAGDVLGHVPPANAVQAEAKDRVQVLRVKVFKG